MKKLVVTSLAAIVLTLSTAPSKARAMSSPCEYFHSTVVVNSPTSWWWAAKCLAYDLIEYASMMTSPFLE